MIATSNMGWIIAGITTFYSVIVTILILPTRAKVSDLVDECAEQSGLLGILENRVENEEAQLNRVEKGVTKVLEQQAELSNTAAKQGESLVSIWRELNKRNGN